MVKKLPANAGDIGVFGWILDEEDPLEEGLATHSSILAWRIHMDRGNWWATINGITESHTTERLSTW